MDYSYLDKAEYAGVPVLKIIENRNGLPFFVAKLNTCNRMNHRHEFVQIIYICKGKLRHSLNNRLFDISEGDIFVVPPYVPHYYIAEKDGDFEIIEFEFVPEFINERFSSHFNENSFLDFAYLEPFLMVQYQMAPRLKLSGSLKLEVESILSDIIHEYSERQSDFILMTKSLLLRLLVLVGRSYRISVSDYEAPPVYTQQRDAMISAIRYVNTHYTKNLSVEDVSKRAMLSQSYFRYLFKQLTGKSLIDYINSERITKAVELLKTKPSMHIIDICYEVGYNHVNYFNKVFLREMGESPSEYRKQRTKACNEDRKEKMKTAGFPVDI